MTQQSVYELPLPLWVLLIVLLLSQGIWIFRDAQKHSRYPWFWGIWGLMQVPTPLVVYLLVVRKVYRKFGKKK